MTVKLGITAGQFREKFFETGSKTRKRNLHAIFLDVRPAEQFSKNHIFGAINLDLCSGSGGSISESGVVQMLESSDYDHIFSGMKYCHVVLCDNFSGENHLLVESAHAPNILKTSKKYPFIKYKESAACSHPLQSLLNVFLQSFLGGGTEFCLAFNVLEGGCATVSTYYPEIMSCSVNLKNHLSNVGQNTLVSTNSGKMVLGTLRAVKAEIEANRNPGQIVVITSIPHRNLCNLGVISDGSFISVRYSRHTGTESRIIGVSMYGLPETADDVADIYNSLRGNLSTFKKLFICPYTVSDWSSRDRESLSLKTCAPTIIREDGDLILSQDMEVFHKGLKAYPENFSLCLFYSLVLSLGPPTNNSPKCVRSALASLDAVRTECLMLRDLSLWLLLLTHETRHSSISGPEFSSLSCSEVWNLCHSSESLADLLQHSHPLNTSLLSQSEADHSLWGRFKRMFY